MGYEIRPRSAGAGVRHTQVEYGAFEGERRGDETRQKGKEKQEESFLGRMQKYMPRHHRAFLRHLATNPRPLRVIVDEETPEGRNPELRIAYN